jgi:hypothetical protein
MAPGQGGNFTLWQQAGVVNVTGSLYKIPAANAILGIDKKRRAQAVWAGMYNMQDISGTANISGNAADNYKWCSVDYAGATCGQPGEAVGDVYINVPQASMDGYAGGFFDVNRINSVPLGQEVLAVVQYFLGGAGTFDGRLERRLTTAAGRYNGQGTYSNARVPENSGVLLFSCTALNLERLDDICAAKLPPNPAAEPGNDFVRIPIPVEGGSPFAEIQFGYAEYGAPDEYFCTSRQEPCNTSSPAAVPFHWESEGRTLTDCSNGCTIAIPVLPDHTVYFRRRTSSDGTNWIDGPLQVAVAPVP